MLKPVWYFIPLFILALSFFGSFISALVFYFQVLRNTRPGEAGKPLIHPFWWVPDNARRILTEEGMRNYWRMLKTLAFGGAMGLAIILLSVLRIVLA